MASNSAGTHRPQQIFIDTNVIIESFRTNCWSSLSAHHTLETVDKCVEEALSGNPNEPSHIRVDATTLKAGLADQHAVDRLMLATFVLENPACAALDDGELHLLAWLKQNRQENIEGVLISTADKAAIVAAHHLDWLDAVVCLEDLAHQAGVARRQIATLAQHHRKTWLDQLKASIRLNQLSAKTSKKT